MAAKKKTSSTKGKSSSKSSPTKPRVRRADSTPRVSESPQESQPGPKPPEQLGTTKSGKPRKPGPTTDTRGAKDKGPTPKPKKSESLEEFRERAGEDLPRNVAAEKQPRPAEDAARIPLRAKNPEQATPVETIKVQGEPVQVVAMPGKLDPVDVKNVSDALYKDRLREQGNPEAADAPVRKPVGGDWADQDVKL